MLYSELKCKRRVEKQCVLKLGVLVMWWLYAPLRQQAADVERRFWAVACPSLV